MISQVLSTCQLQNSVPIEDFAVARFIRFLKHLHLKELFSKISDTRQFNKISYANHCLLLWAFSVFAF
jgi:hypothetical protein